MSKAQDTVAGLRCSFCNKTHAEVKKLIAGNRGVAICDECLDVCNDIVADHLGHPSSWDEHEPIDEPELFSFRCPACGHQWKMARTPTSGGRT